LADLTYENFEWSIEKARRNLREHGVSFHEATTVFNDLFFVVFRSDKHSVDENRYVIIGTSESGRLLAVAFTERKQIRIISARKLTREERRSYENQKQEF
jgi:uncharacterized DUF497 family protein